MNFCFVLNDNYANKLAVVINSIVQNNTGTHNFYILTSGISEKNIRMLKNYAEFLYCKLDVCNVKDGCLEGVPIKRKDFNKTPYYKLLIPLYIPKEIKRILYLDVDMVVRGSLAEMYKVDLGANYFAAVPDPLVNSRDPEYLKRLDFHLDRGERYFNSGMILFDLEKLRQVYTLEIALEYIRKNGKYFKFHDQEVLNGLYGKNYLQLDEKYNYLTIYRGVGDMLKYILGLQTSQLSGIVVLHYANVTKPWSREYLGKYEKEFWKYVKGTPVENELEPYHKNIKARQIKVLASAARRKLCK